MDKISRRDFLKLAGAIGLSTIIPLSSCKGKKIHTIKNVKLPSDGKELAMITGKGMSPSAILDKAIAEITSNKGMKAFINRGDVVTIKPNIGWARPEELAANTNPEIVKRLIELCFNAGASKVKVTDNSTHDPNIAFKASGIEAVCKEMHADLIIPTPSRFKEMKFPDGVSIKKWKVYLDVYESDKLINVPIAKHHNLAKLTLSMKNLYGAVGGSRNKLHQDIHGGIVDLAVFFKPTLTVVDAIRIMKTNGPTGGSLGDVERKDVIIASTNQVAADYYASTLFNIDAANFPVLKIGKERGLGEYMLSDNRVSILDISTS